MIKSHAKIAIKNIIKENVVRGFEMFSR